MHHNPPTRRLATRKPRASVAREGEELEDASQLMTSAFPYSPTGSVLSSPSFQSWVLFQVCSPSRMLNPIQVKFFFKPVQDSKSHHFSNFLCLASLAATVARNRRREGISSTLSSFAYNRLKKFRMRLLKVATCNLKQWAMDFLYQFVEYQRTISKAKEAGVVVRIGQSSKLLVMVVNIIF